MNQVAFAVTQGHGDVQAPAVAEGHRACGPTITGVYDDVCGPCGYPRSGLPSEAIWVSEGRDDACTATQDHRDVWARAVAEDHGWVCVDVHGSCYYHEP